MTKHYTYSSDSCLGTSASSEISESNAVIAEIFNLKSSGRNFDNLKENTTVFSDLDNLQYSCNGSAPSWNLN